MEKMPKIAFVPLVMSWSDVGNWDALYEISNKDVGGNVSSDAVSMDTSHGNFIHANGIRVPVHDVDALLVITANDPAMWDKPKGS